LRKHLGEVSRHLAQQKESRIEEGHLMSDHVHMLISAQDANSPPADIIPTREIVEIEREGREASLRNEVAFFERTMAPDYFGIGPAIA
jgi:REP element-mobilizing transposase RayT